MKALLKDNPNLVFSRDNDGDTPLHYAASFGHRDVAELLLAQKAVVDAKDNDGWTPLHFATQQGHEEITELLLAHKADVNVKNTDGDTPLHMAGGEGYKELVELLLAHKADVDAKDNDGMTPLHIAAANGHKDVVELLRRHGGHDSGSSEEVPTTPDTTIHNAARDGNLAILQAVLKDMPYMVFSKDEYGRTPLHLAAESGRKEEAELWLANKAEVDARDNQGETPLNRAVFGGHKDMVELLLAQKADVDAKDNSGEAPLHLAADYGYKDVVELLLAKSAEINAKNNKGETPLHLAAKERHEDVAEMLRQHGGQEASASEISMQEAVGRWVSAFRSKDSNAMADCYAPLVEKYFRRNNVSHEQIRRYIHSAFQRMVDIRKYEVSDIHVELAPVGNSTSGISVGGATAAFRKTWDTVNSDGNSFSGEEIEQLTFTSLPEGWKIIREEELKIIRTFRQTATPLQSLARKDTLTLTREIHDAARDGDLTKVKALLKDNPGLVLSKDDKGDTPLHLAAENGRKDTAEVLLASKAPVNARNNDGWTPLHYAVFGIPYGMSEGIDHALEQHQRAVTELLLDSHAEVNAKNDTGETPLHLAARAGGYGWGGAQHLVELLLAKGADVNASDNYGATPLHRSADECHDDVVALLLDHHADVNVKNKSGATPLRLAVATAANYAKLLHDGAIPIYSESAAVARDTHVAELLRQHGGHE